MWRRLPTWFPNIKLTMLPISEAELQQVLECGWLREVAFKTEPRVNKFEIKAFLESVHGMEVERVSTINYQGKKQRIIDSKGRAHYKRLSDWKKAYVMFKPPPEKLEEWQQQKQQERKLLQLADEQQQLLKQQQKADNLWRKEIGWRQLSADDRKQNQQQREQLPEDEKRREILEKRFTDRERAMLEQQQLQRRLDGWQQQVQNVRRGVLNQPAAAAATGAQQKQRRQLQQGQQQQPGQQRQLTQGQKSR